MTEINSYAEKSTPASDDELLLQETGGGAYKKLTLSSLDATSLTGVAADNWTWTGTHEFDSTVQFDGAITANAAATLNSSVTIAGQGGIGNSDGLHLTLSKDDEFVGPALSIERTSASPANSDKLGAVEFVGKNDAGTPEDIIYADIIAEIADVADGSEDGALLFRSASGGTIHTTLMQVRSGGVVIGIPTGGAKGAGTLNASAVYDDNSLLTDYVFDAEIDGDVDAQKYDDRVPDRTDEEGKVVEVRAHEPARAFKQSLDELDPAAFRAKWQASRKLPALERAGDDPSLGKTLQAAIETLEVYAVHAARQQDRIDQLEARLAAAEAR